MQGLVNLEVDKWVRPWEKESFDNLNESDDRFFAILTKGVLGWLSNNLLMYNKPIRHFIFNTGSSYLYLENNGYEYTWCETTGENLMYMETPRCVVSVGSFRVPEEELTAPTIRGVYERRSTAPKTKGQILSYNAVLQRLPIEVSFSLKYVFSNFNEAIIFTQEIFECILFQQYFQIVYLGQVIDCSIEFNEDTQISLDQIDLASNEPNRRTMEFDIKVCTNLPIIDTQSECVSTNIIGGPNWDGTGEIDKKQNIIKTNKDEILAKY